jgi:hypothetical protein
MTLLLILIMTFVVPIAIILIIMRDDISKEVVAWIVSTIVVVMGVFCLMSFGS